MPYNDDLYREREREKERERAREREREREKEVYTIRPSRHESAEQAASHKE